MITFKCPSCDKAISAAEDNAGKKGRCPGCKEIFTIPASSPGVKPAPAAERRTTPSAEPAPLPKKKAQPVEEEDEAITEVPKRAKKAPPRDDDDEDDPPAKRSKRRDSEADDEDEDEDRPRRKKRRDDDEDDDRDDSRRRRKRRGPYADCPACGCRGEATKVSWTWWGGVIGPLIINTVRCNRCGVTYNGKHGDYNNTRIAIYVGISLAIGLGLGCIGVLSQTH